MAKLGWLKWAFALVLLCALTAIAATAQTFTTLFDFNGTNGGFPYMSFVQGADGRLYGTSELGGATCCAGIVFRLTMGGKLTPIYSFCQAANCADGEDPQGKLVLGTDGNFYGTTFGGGNAPCPWSTCGTVFKVTPKGVLTTLHSFDGADGAYPIGGLVQANNGVFWGTTEGDGAYGEGTVFQITLSGAFQTVHSFNFYADGAGPYAALTQGTDGNFYGTTSGGGANNGGQGTVFKITPDGALTTLHTFEIGYGATPYGGLVQGIDGNFYGTTLGGGGGWGTVFKITPDGTTTVLHSFTLTDGGEPHSGLALGTDGNFYGTTYFGGDFTCDPLYGCGTLFKITPGGTMTTLHSFNGSDGSNPMGGLTQATNGVLYGTAYSTGSGGDGTVFRLDMGLGPFVAFVRTYGRIGQGAGILGQGFTGATSVSFNGVQASFTIGSDTFIRATVPTGATTGYVTVTTPGGTPTSNVPFQVIQ